MNNYKTSPEGIKLIKDCEGLKLEVYNCPKGLPTIGYGHRLKFTEKHDSITKEQAEKLLEDDLRVAEYTVNRGVKVELSQGQFDALVSLAFNWGGVHFLRSDGLKKLNRHDYQGALAEFAEVNKINNAVDKGLSNRRAAEARLFNGVSQSKQYIHESKYA